MINLIQDGLISFQHHFGIIVCILLVIAWGQIVMYLILSKFFHAQFTTDEYFSFALSGWLFPVFIWAVIFFITSILFGKIIANVISAGIFIFPFFFLKRNKLSLTLIFLFLFLFVSLLFRLAFLQQAIFPAYFDSAEHYKNIQNILTLYEIQTLWMFPAYYYHLGYHFISAAWIHLFQLNPINFMLVFGQIILAVLPFSFFFLLKQITKSNQVAFFTCLIAAVGFHMPAHLINWGKYPALLSLLGIQFVCCLTYIRYKNNLLFNQKLILNIVIAISILITILIHSRTLILFILLIVSSALMFQIKKTSARFQNIFFIICLIFLAVEIYFVQQIPVLVPLYERYIQNDVWILILTLILLAFSYKTYPNITSSFLITMCTSILLLFIPISIQGYGRQTLLDRPFIQMLLYMPFSLIAGMGLSGLLSATEKILYTKPIIYIAVFSFVLLNANFNYKFYPSECCQLVTQDDISAMTWIENNISVDEKILIAAVPLNVTSFEAPTQVASDAGVWINPLTERTVQFAFISTNFESQQEHINLCNQNIKYIYIGATSQSFNEIQFASQPTWYQPIFLLPKAKIYQVLGCE